MAKYLLIVYSAHLWGKKIILAFIYRIYAEYHRWAIQSHFQTWGMWRTFLRAVTWYVKASYGSLCGILSTVLPLI